MTDGMDRNLVRKGADAMIYGLPERLMEKWMVSDARDAAALVIAAVEPDITSKTLDFCCADTEPGIRRTVAEEIAAFVERLHGNYVEGHLCNDAETHDLLNLIEAEARRIGGAPGPSPAGAIEMSDAEFDSFLRAAEGRDNEG